MALDCPGRGRDASAKPACSGREKNASARHKGAENFGLHVVARVTETPSGVSRVG